MDAESPVEVKTMVTGQNKCDSVGNTSRSRLGCYILSHALRRVPATPFAGRMRALLLPGSRSDCGISIINDFPRANNKKATASWFSPDPLNRCGVVGPSL